MLTCGAFFVCSTDTQQDTSSTLLTGEPSAIHRWHAGLQTAAGLIIIIVGVGFTVTVTVNVEPAQVPDVGVTV